MLVHQCDGDRYGACTLGDCPVTAHARDATPVPQRPLADRGGYALCAHMSVVPFVHTADDVDGDVTHTLKGAIHQRWAKQGQTSQKRLEGKLNLNMHCTQMHNTHTHTHIHTHIHTHTHTHEAQSFINHMLVEPSSAAAHPCITCFPSLPEHGLPFLQRHFTCNSTTGRTNSSSRCVSVPTFFCDPRLHVRKGLCGTPSFCFGVWLG